MTIKEKLEIIIEAIDKASPQLKGVVGTLGELSKSTGAKLATAMGAAAGSVAALGSSVIALSQDAASLIPIKEGFDAIADASGASADAMIEALRKKSNYMIKDSELMKSYTLASQLVGDEFANQLPDAMGYLGKVAAATGQDMGYMMDSLVKGVGRMSPMILDNLGIQVNMNQATADYAETLGKSAKELTKTEKQTALMNQVLEKLGENTKNLSESTDPFKQLSATMETLKERVSMSVGEVVLPLVSKLAETLIGFVQGDKFQEWVKFAADKLAEFGETILTFVNSQEFKDWLANVGEIMSTVVIPAIAQTAKFIINDLVPAVKTIANWIGTNLVPVLKTLFAWLTENISPAIEKVAGFFKDPLGVALAALKKAWDSNFLGIRDIVDGLWMHIQLIFKLIKAMFEGDWRKVGETFREIFDNMVKVIKNIDWLELGKSIITGIGNGLLAMKDWLIQAAKDIGSGVLDGFKGFFGIQSPSKVMADQVGLQLARGIGQGLEAGIQGINRSAGKVMPPIIGVTAQSTQRLAPAYASANSPAGGVNLVLNYAPGISFADEFELEQRLKPMLRRLMRQR